jgi:hypothetical protein
MPFLAESNWPSCELRRYSSDSDSHQQAVSSCKRAGSGSHLTLMMNLCPCRLSLGSAVLRDAVKQTRARASTPGRTSGP